MHNLLEKIKDFLSANGWTVNLWADDTSSYLAHASFDYTGGKRLHVQKTASDATVMYFNFRSVTAGVVVEEHNSGLSVQYNDYYAGELRGIMMNGSTGYNVSNSWDKQPGAPVHTDSDSLGSCVQAIPTGTNNVYFFQNGDTVSVVIDLGSGYFNHMYFGCLAKAGSYTGGQFWSTSTEGYQPGYSYNYLSGTPFTRDENRASPFMWKLNAGYVSSAVYYDADSLAGWRFGGSSGAGGGGQSYKLHPGAQSPYQDPENIGQALVISNFIYTRQPNAFNGQAVMMPLYMMAKKSNDRWVYLGTPEGVRVINMSSFPNAGEFTISPDTWKVFPAHTRTESGTTNLYGTAGIAVKKS
jgi:hypothetical protein